MNETTPKISVIVPVYKAENYLHRCVDSLLAQTFQDFEILLIDDGSPDRSGEICDEYARKDKRVRVFHKENGGVSSARNVGLDHARGEWICFVDSDDWVGRTYLKSLYIDALNNHAELVVHGYVMLTIDGKKIQFESYSNRLYKLENGLYDMFVEQNLYYRGSPCSKLYKRFLLVEHGIKFDTDVHYGEDLCFVLDYLSVIQLVYFSSESSYYYIQYGTSSVNRMFAFSEEYAGYLHLKQSFYRLLNRMDCSKECCLPYIAWIAFFLYRSILMLRDRHDYTSMNKDDWAFYAKYFQSIQLKNRIDYWVIVHVYRYYYFLISYIKFRRFIVTHGKSLLRI